MKYVQTEEAPCEKSLPLLSKGSEKISTTGNGEKSLDIVLKERWQALPREEKRKYETLCNREQLEYESKRKKYKDGLRLLIAKKSGVAGKKYNS